MQKNSCKEVKGSIPAALLNLKIKASLNNNNTLSQ